MTPQPPPDLAEMRADEALLPPAPWVLWTSNSFRRITGPDGKHGGVLHAYNQRSDGHPDLSMPENQLFALVRLRNALPALLDRLSHAEAALVAKDAEIAKLRDALQRIADAAPASTNSRTARQMASWTHAVALSALIEEPDHAG